MQKYAIGYWDNSDRPTFTQQGLGWVYPDGSLAMQPGTTVTLDAVRQVVREEVERAVRRALLHNHEIVVMTEEEFDRFIDKVREDR